MNSRLKAIKKEVEYILNRYPETRGNDGLLFLYLLRLVLPETPNKKAVLNAIEILNNSDIPNFKSVFRSRQAVQAEHPDLKIEPATQNRFELEQEYRKIYRKNKKQDGSMPF